MSKKIFGEIKAYTLISFGLLINSFGWTAFLIPSKIVGGGLAGIASLVYFSTGFPVWITLIGVNAILVALAMKILGATFGARTIFGILINSLAFALLQNLFPVPLVTDQFMAALIGAALSGVGIGIAFTQEGASGGTDIIALIVNHYKNISPGRVILYCDIVIIASSWFLFYSIEKIVYGYVVMGVLSYVLDLVIEGNKQSYQMMIFSEQNEVLADRIGQELKRGVSFLHGKGWYSQKENDVIVVICRRWDKSKIMRIINETDPNAFISVSKVMGVFGKNFDRIKL